MSKNKTSIEFINHASVLLTYNQTSILSDPWYFNSVFNKGWRLLYENETNYIENVLDRVNYIYISHEHPDHFNPQFLSDPKIKERILGNKIKFLFQETRDKRVLSFLKKMGFDVQECPLDRMIKLNHETKISISRHDFYDSSILIKFPDASILNLNDCPLRDAKDIKKFKKKIGKVDLLLTQFSYAAWKGPESNSNLRLSSAKEKIQNIIDQNKFLQPKTVLPFASYIYFSNEMNFYMNKDSNKPIKIYEQLIKEKINPVILKPGEIQDVDCLKQNRTSLDFWSNLMKNLHNNKTDKFDKNISLDNLNCEFLNYKKKIFKKNSLFIVKVLNKIKFLNLFQNINIYLIDHKKNYNFSIITGLVESNEGKIDIKMHSESLYFILKNEFGYDTLTVNGCFESSFDKFNKVSKTLALGSLNSMGINLNIFIIFKANIIIIFLKKLRAFINKAKSPTSLEY